MPCRAVPPAEDVYYCSVEYGPEDVRTSLGYYNMAKVFSTQVRCTARLGSDPCPAPGGQNAIYGQRCVHTGHMLACGGGMQASEGKQRPHGLGLHAAAM